MIERRMGFFESDGNQLYKEAVARVNSGIFVEIGCWFGLSTTIMAKYIQESGKNIKFYTVDIFKGSDYSEYLINTMGKYTGEEQWSEYSNYIREQGVEPYIQTLKMTSVEASELFEDKSIDFVFIDGDHNYEAIKKDIESWLPKIKTGGVMAGHDYNAHTVYRAVNEAFPSELYIFGTCWLQYIK